MVVTENTLRRWKEQLALNERLLNSSADRFRWLRKLYIRLYRFLVTRYGDAAVADRSDTTNTEEESESSTMAFADMTTDHRGLQPRTTQSLRMVLDHIHSNQPPAPAKGHLTGKEFESIENRLNAEWVMVANSADYRLDQCVATFRKHKIAFRKRAYGFCTALEVHVEDRVAALEAIKDNPWNTHRRTVRQRIEERQRKFWWMNAVLLVIVLLLAFAISVLSSHLGWQLQ